MRAALMALCLLPWMLQDEFARKETFFSVFLLLEDASDSQRRRKVIWKMREGVNVTSETLRLRIGGVPEHFNAVRPPNFRRSILQDVNV